ncbi:MAG: DUF2924 domain-containing protein [Magnetococcales bacterium]|nr:DUF2924 domain-containing protein [Magnetococcales bacterium]
MNNIEVIRQVAALPGMSIADLKKMWTDLHQNEAPPYNRVFLVKRLAYRLQELSMGGLSAMTEKRIERMAAAEELPPQERKRPPGEKLLPGTQLIREWKGAEHRCTVLDDGFEYQGRKFGSLSAVANFITGTKWNGHVFFALKRQGEKA